MTYHKFQWSMQACHLKVMYLFGTYSALVQAFSASVDQLRSSEITGYVVRHAETTVEYAEGGCAMLRLVDNPIMGYKVHHCHVDEAMDLQLKAIASVRVRAMSRLPTLDQSGVHPIKDVLQ